MSLESFDLLLLFAWQAVIKVITPRSLDASRPTRRPMISKLEFPAAFAV
jgi:hypothetical protein